ncbi:MAG: phosphonate metabolism transcriptional regulator PhnF [Pseudomonadota bacterium]
MTDTQTSPPPTLWRSIEAALRRDIANGRYRPGDKLPTEAELSRRFGVNRHTVRRALGELTREGLTHARRGAGVFVAVRPMTYALGKRVRFHQNLAAAGQTGRKDTLRLETVPARAREATALRLDPGDPVHVWEGVAFADDAPICLFHTFFPAARLPGLKDALAETGSVTAALSADGVEDYTRASTDLNAELAGTLHALHLKLPEGAPLLRSIAVNVDAAGQPVEYGRSWFPGERVTLSVAP